MTFIQTKGRRKKGVNDLSDFLEYSIIRELKSCERFSECLERNQIENTGLLEALLTISQHLKTRFIFIMDEWDLVYREYRNNEVLQKKFIQSRCRQGLFFTCVSHRYSPYQKIQFTVSIKRF